MTDDSTASKELQQKLEYYHKVINSMKDGYLVHCNGIIREVNDQLSRIIGISPSEIIGRHFSEFVDKNDRELIEFNIQNNFPAPYEIRTRRGDGETLYLELLGGPIAGTERGRVVIVRDITEKKKIETILRDNEEKFRALTDQSILGIYTIEDGKIGYANDLILQLTGYSREEILLWEINGFLNLVHPDDRPFVERQALIKMSGDCVHAIPNYDFRIITKSGELRWVSLYSKSVRVSNRNIVMSAMLDITEKKAFEEELKFNKKKYEQIVNSTSDIIYTLDLKGNIIYCNPAAYKTTGYSETDLVGKSYLDFVREDYKKTVFQFYRNQNQKRIPSTYMEFPILTKDGDEIWIEQNVQITFSGKDISGYHIVCRNTTIRKRAEMALSESESRFRLLADATFDGIIIHDANGIIIANQAFFRMSGYNPLQVIGKNLLEYITLEHHDIYLKNTLNRYQHPFEVDLINNDGHILPVELRCDTIIFQGDEMTVLAVRDLSLLKESQRRFEQITRNMVDIICQIDRKGIIEYISTPRRMTGYEVSEVVGHSLFEFVHADDVETINSVIKQVLIEKQDPVPLELRVRHANKSFIWVEVTGNVTSWNNEIVGAVFNIRDISERKRSEFLELHDEFTNLLNLKGFERKLSEEILATEKSDKFFAVMTIDLSREELDKIRHRNPGFGNDMVNILIQDIADSLSDIFFKRDSIARTDECEFTVLLPLQTYQKVEDEAIKIVNKAIKHFSRDFRGQTKLDVSIGLSIYPTDYKSSKPGNPSKVLSTSRQAAKTARDNRKPYMFYDERLHRELIEKLDLEKDLRLATGKLAISKAFKIFYQPRINMQGRIVGLEALMRWMHPQRGLLPPSSFITISEETGMIQLIEDEILRRACHQLKLWHKITPDLQLSVNISPRHLNETLLSSLKVLLEKTGIPPHLLELEIIEREVVKDESITILNQIKGLGCHLAIDDFGTEYSALAKLPALPDIINTVKLDK